MPHSILNTLQERASTRVDARSAIVFRVLLGGLVAWSAARFLINGWVAQFFLEPTFFFKYWGFSWLHVPSEPVVYAMFIALTLCGVAIASGRLYHVASVGALALFSIIEFWDVTNYLNHYYLVSLLLLLTCWMPLGARRTSDTLPAWMLWLLRFQVATVYFWAGMAKFGTDWLIHAEPMHLWMRARVDTPVIGPMLAHWWVALAMSWAGFLFDSTIWAFLLWKPTRRVAYAIVVGFHMMTGMLFNIGLFPVIMICGATLFFSPDWPARFGMKRREEDAAQVRSSAPARWQLALIALFCTWQVLMPARHLLYKPSGGDVLWDEQGMRWSWKVMVREKNGAITYLVRLPTRRRDLHVPPTRYLTDHQAREMSGQPDLILQLAKHIGQEYRAKGHDKVEVRVDAKVSLNGRPPHPLIDPEVDLMAVDDGLMPADWILPPPPSRQEITKWIPHRLER